MTAELAGIDAEGRRRLAAIADHLIPAAHSMPSAADIVTEERLGFVLTSRPDLVEPLAAALRADLSDDPATRLTTLEEADPTALATLQLVIVAAYYTDAGVRERIGYPGQLAIPLDGDEPLLHVESELIDNVRARGPVWRDPSTGVRATADADRSTPTYEAVAPGATQGGTDGRHGS
jgi:hypothetical protein